MFMESCKIIYNRSTKSLTSEELQLIILSESPMYLTINSDIITIFEIVSYFIRSR